MSRKEIDLDKLLDQTLEQIRNDGPSAEAEQQAAQRVWDRVRDEAARVSSELPENLQIRDCSDFQALIPAYLRGALTDAKALLLEDHTSECIPCRRALKQARAGARATGPAAAVGGRSWVSTFGWRAAAAAVIFLALVGLSIQGDLFTIKAGGLVHIEAIDGKAFHVTEDGSKPLTIGQRLTLEDGDTILTSKGSRAMLRLEDDSQVEMNARCELGVIQQRKIWSSETDAVVDLDRGNIIIEASDQGSGHLFVNADDSRVAVTGTVFAVNRGVKGTRVSVIEGEVEVRYAGTEEILLPGQQATTHPGLSKVPVEDEIASSQNFEQHLALLRDVAELSRELNAVLSPDLRHSTSQLERTPAETVIYIGIPNVSDSLGEAYSILQQKIDSSEALRAWWEENVVPNGGDEQLELVIDKIRVWGDHLGDEIAVTMQLDAQGEVRPPIVLADLTQPAAFRSFVEQELADLDPDLEVNEHVHIIETAPGELPTLPDPSGDPNQEALYLWIHGNQLTVAFQHQAIYDYAVQLGGVGLKGTPDQTFRQRLGQLYRDGVEWVVGVDIERIFAGTMDEGEAAELDGFGILDMQHLIAERKQRGERTENRIVLTFGQERRGMAALLDEPAPMGSLRFISTDPGLAAAFVMREPRSLVDDLFATLASVNEDFESELAEFEREHSIDVRKDFAEPLGGEVAFALDGPLVPKPSWKLILEVYGPEQFQQTLTWAVEQLNQQLIESGHDGLQIESEETGGQVFYRIHSLDVGVSAHYMYSDGYFVAAASKALLIKALQYSESGTSLEHSRNFTSLMPQDGELNFSAVVYQHLAPTLGPLAQTISNATGNLTKEQQRLIDQVTSLTRPSLSVAYGEPDRISVVYTHEGGLFGNGLGTIFSLRSLMDVQELLGHAAQQGAHSYTAPEPDGVEELTES